jgi:CDP-glycerol glycerophosphotransferase (TagB/SpsB family)
MIDKIFRWIPFIMLYFPFKIFSFFSSKKNVYLFGTGTGYFHDNPKYLFLEFLKLENLKEEVYWVAKTNKAYNELKKKGYPVIKRNSLIAVYYTAVAKAFIVSAELFDVAYFINDYTKLVQLWHGTPIKHIGIDNKIDKDRNDKKAKWLGKNYTFDRFDLYFVDEQEYIPIFLSAFGCQKEKIKAFGQIRNKVWKDKSLKEKIKKDLELESYSKILLYAPTYRDSLEDNIILIKSLIQKVAVNKLKNNNAVLLIKLHPFLTNGTINFPDEITNNDNIIDVSGHTDFQELLLISDCLITDLSSCVLDYKYSGKPFFSFFPDKEKYITSRDGVYLTFNDITESSKEMCNVFQDFDSLSLIDCKIDVKQIINKIL